MIGLRPMRGLSFAEWRALRAVARETRFAGSSHVRLLRKRSGRDDRAAPDARFELR